MTIRAMNGKPEVLLHRDPGRPKISLILIDWGVRESFHSLHYLNRQTADRGDYELIWLEFYDRKPEGLQRAVAAGGPRTLDKWYVLGYPDDFLYHKHRLYNAGLLASAGDVCVICDSDAVYSPTFVESIIRAFEETPRAVVHLDQVRNNDPRFYPFNYPRIEEILGPGCVNWNGETASGLCAPPKDFIHQVNYGACMAARRCDMLAVGGADEHPDYLGYYCGPYEMTFRLVNYHGRHERWLRHEHLYHVWHPNTSGSNTDYRGANDGRGMSLRALDARASLRVEPYRKNPLVGRDWRGRTRGIRQFLDFVRTREEPAWEVGAQPAGPPDCVYWAERGYEGWNIFAHAGTWYAVGDWVTAFDPRRARQGGYHPLLQGHRVESVQAAIDAYPAAGGSRGSGGGPLDGIRRRLLAQPLHRLPRRAWRQSRRLLSSLWPERPPWPAPLHTARHRPTSPEMRRELS
jgi:hypothetical protein